MLSARTPANTNTERLQRLTYRLRAKCYAGAANCHSSGASGGIVTRRSGEAQNVHPVDDRYLKLHGVIMPSVDAHVASADATYRYECAGCLDLSRRGQPSTSTRAPADAHQEECKSARNKLSHVIVL